MKAIIMEGFGGPEVLQYTDFAEPVPEAGEIAVDVYAASVNPTDCKVRQGGYGHAKITFPYILGRDFSGHVRALGSGVTDFAIGDAVFGVLKVGHEGTYAEVLTEEAAIIASKPDSWSHVDAAALALGGLTALVSLEDEGKLQSGETILIHGAAGGVGNFAVQYARHVGARVIATASPRNHAYLKDLGADEVIDYNTQDFVEAAPECDLVYDLIGGDTFKRSYNALKSGGRLVFISGPALKEPPLREDVTVIRPNVARDRAHMERIIQLVDAGAVKVPELETMPLADAVRAQELSGSGHVRGKIILLPRGA